MDALKQAFTDIMVKIDPKTFYQEVFKKSMDRANIESKSIMSNPPARSELAKYLNTLSKSARAGAANSSPFRVESVNVNKGKASMHGSMGTGTAQYLRVNSVKPVDQILEEAVVAEVLANADDLMKNVVLDAIKKGELTIKKNVSRESGE